MVIKPPVITNAGHSLSSEEDVELTLRMRWSKVCETAISFTEQSHRGAHYSEIGLQVKEFNARVKIDRGIAELLLQAGISALAQLGVRGS